MRRITFRLIVAVLAFAIGIIGVWLTGLYPKIEDFLVDRLSAPLNLDTQTKFKPTGRGCGPNGYTQSYQLPDGQEMSEGSFCPESSVLANQEVQDMLAKASRIVERVPRFKNRFQQEGERIVLVFPPDNSGKKRASILWLMENVCCV